MNLSDFFDHWSITQNPFRGEEARHDEVLARMSLGGAAARPAAMHSDFEKILGDLRTPATSIVFGEKGSGKTAIRLQIEQRVRAHNEANPTARVLLVPYDDLNSMLDRFCANVKGESVTDCLSKLRLVDHIDAVLGVAVPMLVDAALGAPAEAGSVSLGDSPRRTLRSLPASARRDFLLLQAIYDRPIEAEARTPRLRRLLRLPMRRDRFLGLLISWTGWIPGAALLAWTTTMVETPAWLFNALAAAGGALLLLWLIVLVKVLAWDRLAMRRLGRRIRKQHRVSSRAEESYARSLVHIDAAHLQPANLPLTDSDEQRYAMLERLRGVLAAIGYTGMIVVVDRIDEPTLISGDGGRMKSVIWPLLNNKLLQQSGIGFKLLLPIELRYALLKESSAFFQEARLDKQHLVDRLTWSGAMLYDLCDARLQACRAPDVEPISLTDLFADDVTQQDLVDALDQMHQPRDAFKFLYACLSEHCSNVTKQSGQWRVPRLVMESVKKQQVERIQALYRGISPA